MNLNFVIQKIELRRELPSLRKKNPKMWLPKDVQFKNVFVMYYWQNNNESWRRKIINSKQYKLIK